MKKINLITSILTCTAVLSSSVLSANAVDTVTITPDLYANFTVVDENGAYIDDASMELLDSNGNIVASWIGNDSSSATSDYLAGDSFSKSIDGMLDVPNVDGETIDSVSVGGYSYSDEFDFNYGENYNVKIRYLENTETVLTVPANKMLINVDSAMSNKTEKVGIGIGEEIYDKEIYYFNDIAGQEVLYDMETGKHNAYTCLGSGSGSGGHVTISDQPTTYTKATINLHELAPNYFNADGTTDLEAFDTEYNFNYGVDTDISAALYIISGAVVNAVIPDENANVTVYIENSTYDLSFSTEFSWSSGGGGGVNGASLNYYKDYEFDINTVDMPNEGVNLVNLEPGEYTLRQTNTLDGYAKPEDMTVVLENSSDIQLIEMVNKEASETTTTTEVTTTVSSNTTTTTTKPVTTTSAVTTTKKATTTTKKATNSPKTGVSGIGSALSLLISAGALAVTSRSKKNK